MEEIDGLNAGYARLLLDEYLENPESVPAEWRALFERGDAAVAEELPGLARLVRALRVNGDRAAAPAPAPAPVAEPPAPPAAAADERAAAFAAATALVSAYRTQGHLAARLDPLGAEPVGDPALDPGRTVPPLTTDLKRQIPASVLRVHVPGETLAEVLPHLHETYCGTLAYEIEHISNHEERVWLRHCIE